MPFWNCPPDPDRPEAVDSKPDDDPIRAMVGLGKDEWKRLGGGEAILRWLRSDDPDARPPWADSGS